MINMADVDLTITIKDEHVSRIMDALNNNAGKSLEIEIVGYGKRWAWTYAPKGGDTSKEFAERFRKNFCRKGDANTI